MPEVHMRKKMAIAINAVAVILAVYFMRAALQVPDQVGMLWKAKDFAYARDMVSRARGEEQQPVIEADGRVKAYAYTTEQNNRVIYNTAWEITKSNAHEQGKTVEEYVLPWYAWAWMRRTGAVLLALVILIVGWATGRMLQQKKAVANDTPPIDQAAIDKAHKHERARSINRLKERAQAIDQTLGYEALVTEHVQGLITEDKLDEARKHVEQVERRVNEFRIVNIAARPEIGRLIILNHLDDAANLSAIENERTVIRQTAEALDVDVEPLLKSSRLEEAREQITRATFRKERAPEIAAVHKKLSNLRHDFPEVDSGRVEELQRQHAATVQNVEAKKHTYNKLLYAFNHGVEQLEKELRKARETSEKKEGIRPTG